MSLTETHAFFSRYRDAFNALDGHGLKLLAQAGIITPALRDAALLAAQEPKKAELPPKEDGQKMVQLKQLCPEGLETRIARRRLRKALGNVGTGSRWEWPEGSEELAKIKAILAPQPAASPVPATEPDPDLAQDLVTPIEEIEETDE